MTKQQAALLQKGDIVSDNDGNVYAVLRICPVWNGALTSKQLKKEKPDGYEVKISDSPWLSFNHKKLKVVANV